MTPADIDRFWRHVERGFAALTRRSRPEPVHGDQFYIDTLHAVIRRGKPVRLYPDDAARILRIIEGRKG